MTDLHYDIVGSFLREPAVKQAKADFHADKIEQEKLTQIEDQAVKKTVQSEIKHGLKVVTDGEQRRDYWNLDTFWGFGGIKHIKAKSGYVFHDETTKPDAASASGRIHFTGDHPDLRAFKYLKMVVDQSGANVIPRQSIPAPAQLYAELYRDPEAVHQVYPDDQKLRQDIEQAYHDLILALYKAGCRDVKLDDCTWGLLLNKDFAEKTGYAKLGPRFVEINNAAIADLPADLRISTHICRGNFHSTWAFAGGYDAVADLVFAQEKVDAFYLEFDSKRAGGFPPIAKIPKDKEVVLGLVTSKTPGLEKEDFLKKRIKDASQYHPFENLALSTQCGFSSTEEGNKLTPQEQWAKIDLVVKTAKDVWPS